MGGVPSRSWITAGIGALVVALFSPVSAPERAAFQLVALRAADPAQTLLDFEIAHLKRRPEFKSRELFVDDDLAKKLKEELRRAEMEKIEQIPDAQQKQRAQRALAKRLEGPLKVADVLSLAGSGNVVRLDEKEAKRLAAALYIENQEGRRAEESSSDGEAARKAALKTIEDAIAADPAREALAVPLDGEVKAALLDEVNKRRKANGQEPTDTVTYGELRDLLEKKPEIASLLGDKKKPLGLDLLANLRMPGDDDFAPNLAAEASDYAVADGLLPSAGGNGPIGGDGLPEPAEGKRLAKTDSMDELSPPKKGKGAAPQDTGEGSTMPVKPGAPQTAQSGIQPDVPQGQQADPVTPVPEGGFNVTPGGGLVERGGSSSGANGKGSTGPIGRHCQLDQDKLDELKRAEREFRRVNGIPDGMPFSVPAVITFANGERANCHVFGVATAVAGVTLGTATHCLAGSALAVSIKIGRNGEYGTHPVTWGTSPSNGALTAEVMDRSDFSLLRTGNDPRLAVLPKLPLATRDADSGAAVAYESGSTLYGCLAHEATAGERNFAEIDARYLENRFLAGTFPGHSGSISYAVVNGRLSVIGTLSAKALASNANHKVVYTTTRRARGEALARVGSPPPSNVIAQQPSAGGVPGHRI